MIEFPALPDVVAVIKARTERQYRGTGFYRVTVGGYVVGAVEKTDDGAWIAKDENDEQVGERYGRRGDAAAELAKTEGAREAYRNAAHEGVFGTAIQQAARDYYQNLPFATPQQKAAKDCQDTSCEIEAPHEGECEKDEEGYCVKSAPCPRAVCTTPGCDCFYSVEVVDEPRTQNQTDSLADVRAVLHAIAAEEGACPACLSDVRAERWTIPGSTGMSVECEDDWHGNDDLHFAPVVPSCSTRTHWFI